MDRPQFTIVNPPLQVAYGILLDSLGKSGKSQEAEAVFREMLDTGITINETILTMMMRLRSDRGNLAGVKELFHLLEKPGLFRYVEMTFSKKDKGINQILFSTLGKELFPFLPPELLNERHFHLVSIFFSAFLLRSQLQRVDPLSGNERRYSRSDGSFSIDAGKRCSAGRGHV